MELRGCDRQTNGPSKDVPDVPLGTCDVLHYMAEGMKTAHGTQVAHRLSVGWEMTLAYLGGPELITRLLVGSRGRREKENQREGSMRRTGPVLRASKGEEGP